MPHQVLYRSRSRPSEPHQGLNVSFLTFAEQDPPSFVSRTRAKLVFRKIVSYRVGEVNTESTRSSVSLNLGFGTGFGALCA
jgi:hypothetical protein